MASQAAKEAASGGADKFLESFGLVIAYLCPGFLTLWAAQTLVPVGSLPGEAEIGGFLFVLVASLGIGVFLSGVRYVVVNEFIFKLKRVEKQLPPQRDFDEALRRDPGLESAYKDIRAAYFPYFQFFSHMLVAVPIVYVTWLVAHWPLSIKAYILSALALVVIEYVLYRNTIYSTVRYRERRMGLFKNEPGVAGKGVGETYVER